MALTRAETVKRCQRKRVRYIQNFKAERGCARCPERRVVCLDLHHRDPSTKNPKLTKIKGSGRHYTGGSRWCDLSYAEIDAELAKCDVLCANCHRVETATQRATG